MAPKKLLTTIKYSVPGTQPPIFLAGSFSSPEWQPAEMEYTTDEKNEHEFYKEVEVEEEKEYQYKFRIGLGDWWILNEGSPTGMSLYHSTFILNPSLRAMDFENMCSIEETDF